MNITLRDSRALIATIRHDCKAVSGRDRVFSAALAHMAEHSHDVRSILDGMRRAAEKRERLAGIIAGIRETP